MFLNIRASELTPIVCSGFLGCVTTVYLGDLIGPLVNSVLLLQLLAHPCSPPARLSSPPLLVIRPWIAQLPQRTVD